MHKTKSKSHSYSFWGSSYLFEVVIHCGKQCDFSGVRGVQLRARKSESLRSMKNGHMQWFDHIWAKS